MNKPRALRSRSMEGLAAARAKPEDSIQPFVVGTRSPADSMQFVALKYSPVSAGRQKTRFSVPQIFKTISKSIKAFCSF
jgi:hypothetical protein